MNYRITIWFERGIDTERYTVQKHVFWKFWRNVYTFTSYKNAIRFIVIMFRKKKKVVKK